MTPLMKTVFYVVISSCTLFVPAYFSANAGIGEKGFHSLFTESIQRHVVDGLVDYEGFKNDERFQQYLKLLSRTDPSSIKSQNVCAGKGEEGTC